MAAPASARAAALCVWWSAAAVGSGTRMLGLPQAHSSATVIALAAAEHEQRGTGGEEPELDQCGVATPRLGHADRVTEREHGRARTDAQALARFGKSQMDLPRAPREPARRQAGKCVLLLEHGGEPALLRAPDHGARGVAAGARHDHRLLSVEHAPYGGPRAPCGHQRAHVVPPGAPVDRLHRQEVMTKRIARQHLRLDPALRADEHGLNSLPRVLQGLGQGECGHEMAAGSTSGEENSHRTSDCGLWIADCGLERESSIADAWHAPRRTPGPIRNPKSAVRNVTP